jgi:hypothetical protein
MGFFPLAGSSIWASIALAKFEMEDSVWGNRALKSMNLFLSLTLCTNIICTGAFQCTFFTSEPQVPS